MSYVEHGDSNHSPKHPLLDDAQGSVAIQLVTQVEKFALAHEFGHAIAGHFDYAAVVHRDGAEFLDKARQDEFEADRIGVDCLMARSFTDGVPGPLELDSIVAGPLLFFALDEAVEAIRGSGSLTSAQREHPPSSERAQAVRNHLRVRWNVPERGFSLADSYVRSLESCVRRVLGYG